MKPTTTSQNGFTLLELVTVTAVIAVLGAVAVHLYGYYTDRARAVDIIGKYDAIRSGSTAALRTQSAVADDCAALAANLGATNLANAHAALTYGFQAVPGGYRPVLNVCAQAGAQGTTGVRVAREAHDTLAKNGVVEAGPVLMDSVVSFSLRLTDGDRAICKSWTAAAASPCSQQTLPSGSGGSGPAQVPIAAASSPAVVPPPAQAASQPVAQPPQPPASRPGVGQPPGQGPGKPVTGVPAQASPTAVVRPPVSNPPQAVTGGGGPVDIANLQTWAMGQPAMRPLIQRERETVAATVAMMANNVGYAQVVKAALASTSNRDASVAVPTSAQAHTTVVFTGSMRWALEDLYPKALTQACYMRYGENARCP